MRPRQPRSTRTDTLFPARRSSDLRRLKLERIEPRGTIQLRASLETACCLRLPSSGYSGQSGSALRSEEHTSELQSLMRISYAVFCLKKKKHHYNNQQLVSALTT